MFHVDGNNLNNNITNLKYYKRVEKYVTKFKKYDEHIYKKDRLKNEKIAKFYFKKTFRDI